MTKAIYLLCSILCLLVRTQTGEIEPYTVKVLIEITVYSFLFISWYNFLITKGE